MAKKRKKQKSIEEIIQQDGKEIAKTIYIDRRREDRRLSRLRKHNDKMIARYRAGEDYPDIKAKTAKTSVDLVKADRVARAVADYAADIAAGRPINYRPNNYELAVD